MNQKMKHPLDNIHENRSEPIRRPKQGWEYDATQNPTPAYPPKRRKISDRWIGQFVPKAENHSYPVAKQSNVPVSWTHHKSMKRVPITVIDDTTGEPKQVLMRMIVNTIYVMCYGKEISFSKSNRGQTILDSRENKRRSVDFIISELTRILGQDEGIKAGMLLTE